MFTITGDTAQDMLMVPDVFIRSHMKEANIAQVKVYLYLLYMEKEQKGADISDIADEYNFTEKDVVRSLQWLEEHGLIKLTINRKKLESVTILKQAGLPGTFSARSSNAPVPAKVHQPAAGECHVLPSGAGTQEHSAGKDETGTGGMEETRLKKEENKKELPAPKRLNQAEFEEFLGKEENMRLKFIIEQYLGKPLTVGDVSELCYISTGLHFSKDLIDYLVQYAVDRDHRRMTYIRGIAQNWAAYGISTVPQAMEKGEAAEAAAKKKTGRKAAGTKTPAEIPIPEERWEGEGSYIENYRQKLVLPNSRNVFNNFEQNAYDFDALEKELTAR